MHKTYFIIDGFERFFEGYTDGTYWNGWATPWFTKEVADEILQTNNEANDIDYHMEFNAQTDTYICQGGFEDALDEFEGKNFIIDGEELHLYPIGAWCWVWDNVADYQTREEKAVFDYLLFAYDWLSNEDLYHCYYGIIQETNGNMYTRELLDFADEFITTYNKGRNSNAC